jgi:ATP-dependent helicase/nuclease subunit B
MAAEAPRLFTIAPDQPFLETLARAVLSGFPAEEAKVPGPLDLARWTILLPTRRAVRALEDIFLRLAGRKGVLLPRIRPLGDIDEDLLAPLHPLDELAQPLSRPGQLLLLIDLIDDWAATHPASRLALEIAGAPHLAVGLAQSLAEFLDSLETEEIDASRLADLYGLEAARHREAILEFLAIVKQVYPQRLHAEQLIGPQARRSAILRREARRLAFTCTERPFIAAGSTGTIPATCELLKAIAGLRHGAVVLPGLDTTMDEQSWVSVGPTHPQHAMKQLLARLNASRSMVQSLGVSEQQPRVWLASELMRPAETADHWHEALKGQEPRRAAAMQGVELVSTRSIEEQAVVAALILRECLETPGRSACLVTPDRQLARRVKAELRRWNIDIADSAGEPLIRSGGAALLNLLLEALLQGFAAEPLAALLRHDMACFGLAAEDARRHSSLIELALLRTGTGAPEIGKLAHALRLVVSQADLKRSHLLLGSISTEQWEEAAAHCVRISEILAPLLHDPPASLAGHIDRLVQACEAMAGESFHTGEGADLLHEALGLLRTESRLLSGCSLMRAAAIIRNCLQALPLRSAGREPLPIRILGLLEARLIRADVMVLAGLNEGTWPGPAESGPWINRPMRDILAMRQPETQIGQTAHDFVQAFANAEVKLLWSRRVGDSPATPSRWILRLLMMLGLSERDEAKFENRWVSLARRLASSGTVSPVPMPRPRPSRVLRPKSLSVTRIETLIRDPYAIYARHVLGLEPVKPVTSAPDPARRGVMIHGAIGDFLGACPRHIPDDALLMLESLGARHFAQIADYPGLMSFWWPRFRRAARWFVENEPTARRGVEQVIAECRGSVQLHIAGEPFTLTCRADRIDLLANGSARITDYKTGEVPTLPQVKIGLAPQLTLQAAILARGGFEMIEKRAVAAIGYVHLTGGEPAGEDRPLDVDVMELAERHLAGLTRLLGAYANADQAYLPRAMMEREEDESDYDHLSRFREWTLAGDLS